MTVTTLNIYHTNYVVLMGPYGKLTLHIKYLINYPKQSIIIQWVCNRSNVSSYDDREVHWSPPCGPHCGITSILIVFEIQGYQKMFCIDYHNSVLGLSRKLVQYYKSYWDHEAITKLFYVLLRIRFRNPNSFAQFLIKLFNRYKQNIEYQHGGL